MTPPAWQRVTWVTSPEHLEVFEAVLAELGALSVSTQDASGTTWIETTPGALPPWTRVRVQALFALDTDLGAIEPALERFVGDSLAHSGQVEWIEDRDWVHEWMRHARPLRFGSRLWVCPTSAALPRVSKDAVTVRLDPGLGFGTGRHESTALCLEWLASQPLRGRRVLDYGCGSGILGIAALLLGATHVRACDVDRHALQATRENAQRNGVAQHIWVGFPAELSNQSADVVVANIQAATLIERAVDLAQRQPTHGDLVLSGILAPQAAEVETAFARWYEPASRTERDDWVLLHLQRHASERFAAP